MAEGGALWQKGGALGQQGAPPCYSSLWETLGHLHLPSIRSIVFAPFIPSNLPIRINILVPILQNFVFA